MKKIFLTIAFVAFSVISNAQFSEEMISLLDKYPTPSAVPEEKSAILFDAIKPALTVIRQQYRLERGGEYYGKNNLPFYGETYTLCVKISGGTIMQRGVLIPWENDTDYHRVKQGGKYKPAIYWSLQKSLSDSIWRTVELELEKNQYLSPVDRDSLLFHHEDAKSDFGLPIDETSGMKKGYLVWAYSNTNIQDSTMQVDLRQVSYHIESSADSVYYSVNPKEAEKIIGGIFVVPVIERVGYIKLQMAGIATKNKEGKWVLCLLAKKTDGNVKNEESEKKDNRQRKKKDESESKPEEAVDEFDPTPIK